MNSIIWVVNSWCKSTANEAGRGSGSSGKNDVADANQKSYRRVPANLTVGQHEIVAVTTRFAERALKVVMTKNYARDDGDPLPPGPHPMISSPSEPGDLQGRSALEYMTQYTMDVVNYW